MQTAREENTHASSRPLASSGVRGLDEVLGGGLTPNRLYLVEGVPGSGKTTLALQFLLEGVRLGEQVLYVTLSESTEELADVVAAHGWSLDGITVRELTAAAESLAPDKTYTMFHPSEVELSETTRTILADVDRIKPTRIVFDSLSELRLLAGNALRYRRQILALKQFFSGRRCTVMLLDDMTSEAHDLQVQSIAHGVIRLEQLNPDYGTERRRLRVVKFRGVGFRGGYHDYIIRAGGLQVFPRLAAGPNARSIGGEKLTGSLESLDQLFGGGLETGTSTLITGAAGTGKSTVAAQFVHAAAERGQRSAMFLFDEGMLTLIARTASLGIDLAPHIASGMVTVRQIDPAEMSPGELSLAVCEAVERGVGLVVIDSLNGYLNAMPGERHLIVQLHEMLTCLSHANVATLLISAQHGLIGTNMISPVDASYLADSVVLMRYLEAHGEVRQSISVLKKRGGYHERSIREFRMADGAISIGEPLREFRGVLTGVPQLVGESPDPRKAAW